MSITRRNTQPEIVAEVKRLGNSATATSRFVERHCRIMENPVVSGIALIASCGAGGALGHWYQDGMKKFDLLHPSLGAMIGAIGGVVAVFSVIDWAHKKLMHAAFSTERYEKSSLACDALISGYITEASVQMDLLNVVRAAKRPDGGWPEGIRFKLVAMHACDGLEPEVKKLLFQ